MEDISNFCIYNGCQEEHSHDYLVPLEERPLQSFVQYKHRLNCISNGHLCFIFL